MRGRTAENLVVYTFLVLLAAVVALLMTSGCCTYHGQRISNDQAEMLIRMGEDVQCN